MKSIRSVFIRGLGAAVTLAAVAFCSLNAQAEVVFGNLAATGIAPHIADAADDFASEPAAVNWLAQEGNTGRAAPLTLASATLGLSAANAGTTPLAVSLVSLHAAGLRQAALPMSDFAVVDSSLITLADVQIHAITTSIALPSGSSTQLSAGLRLVPRGRNGSGFSYTRILDGDEQPTGSWNETTVDVGSSGKQQPAENVTMEAVPEPSSAVIAGFGILGLAVMQRRRRRK